MTPIHLILADDDPDDCLIFSEVFKETVAGGKITCVSDCESLLKYLESASHGEGECLRPDIIFLDLNMPLMSGQECLKKLMAHEVCQNVPVIIYSTASKKDIIDECYALGASLYVVKPNDTLKLRDTILEIIKTFIKRKAIAP